MPSLIASAQTKDWNPTLRDVDEQKETVAGQIDKIIQQDSPLSQTARTASVQEANKRGLRNSSMAVQAGQQAVINAALPIAAADAATYVTKSRDNQAAGNAAGQFNTGEFNQTSRFNAGEENAATKMVLGADLEKSLIGSRTDAQSRLQTEQAAQQQALQAQRGQQETTLQTQRGEQETSLQNIRGTQERELQTMRGEQAKVLADIEASNRTLIQASAQAATLFSDIQRQIAAVQVDANLSVAQKQAAVNRLTQQLETGLALFGGMANVDIRGLLNFGGAGDVTPAAKTDTKTTTTGGTGAAATGDTAGGAGTAGGANTQAGPMDTLMQAFAAQKATGRKSPTDFLANLPGDDPTITAMWKDAKAQNPNLTWGQWFEDLKKRFAKLAA